MPRNLLLCLVFLFIQFGCSAQLPDGFTYVDEMESGIVLEIRYATSNNFTGKKVPGYNVRKAVLTTQAAKALYAVQQDLQKQGLGLKIFDAYRPQRSVDHFVRWAEDLGDTLKKSAYYPQVKKSELFEKGYIASNSGHSRGSTVDVTLIDLETGRELDMGTPYDYFSPLSHPDSPHTTDAQRDNRMLLQKVMRKHGFIHLPTEWWHFTLNEEPFPDTYFDFVVE